MTTVNNQRIGFFNEQLNPYNGGQLYNANCTLVDVTNPANKTYSCRLRTTYYDENSEEIGSQEDIIDTDERNLPKLFDTGFNIALEKVPGATEEYPVETETTAVRKKRQQSQISGTVVDEEQSEEAELLPNAVFDIKYTPKLLINPEEVFEEIKVLGKGNYGRVILVKSKVSGILYALKLIPLLDKKNRETLNQFEEEVDSLIEVSKYPDCNSGISCYYDSFQLYYKKNTQHYEYYYGILMEYIFGTTLHEYIRDGHVTQIIADQIFLWLTYTLAEIHDKNVVHRDIKPENIMITPDGQAKLIDFGFSCVLSGRIYEYCRRAVGSPHFVAPEIANGSFQTNVEYLKKADVFSAGVTLYQVVEGIDKFPYEISQLPFKLNTTLNLMKWADSCYDSIVYEMIRLNPNERPTAADANTQFNRECLS